MVDPERTHLDATVDLGRDVTLYPGHDAPGRLHGRRRGRHRPRRHLVDTAVGAGAHVVQTSAVKATIGAGATVGPWAALGPGDEVASGVTTGPHYAGPNAGSPARQRLIAPPTDHRSRSPWSS